VDDQRARVDTETVGRRPSRPDAVQVTVNPGTFTDVDARERPVLLVLAELETRERELFDAERRRRAIGFSLCRTGTCAQARTRSKLDETGAPVGTGAPVVTAVVRR
jgi:hypothetical protein